MKTTRLGTTDLAISTLCLGGNVFGWSADEAASFAVLDAYAEAGGNFIDAADVYSQWVPGNHGGESETILGKWMAARKNRDRLVIATKVGLLKGHEGLAPSTIRGAIEGSLARLGTDRIDLYYAHIDDNATPLGDTLVAFDGIVRAGKARYVAASQYGAARLGEALAISKRDGLAPYVALTTEYNLVARGFEKDLRGVCAENGVAALPFYGLARGFLSGKYRRGVDVESVRAEGAKRYATPEGYGVVDALATIAASRGLPIAAVALAWLRARDAVAAPIASARTVDQLEEALASVDVTLTPDETKTLDDASAYSLG